MIRDYIEVLWLVPLLPLLGCVINGLMGQRFGKRFTTFFAVGSVWIAFAVALALAGTYVVSGGAPQPIDATTPFNWFDSGQLQLKMGLLLDPLSIVMMLIVTGVGGLIHVYSVGYMADDPGYNRYFAYLNLFTFSMLMLVLADSFLLMFVGWELVGLCSYLLIGFWYDRQSATDAGKKAFVVNRVGDWAFVIGIALTFVAFAPRVQLSGGLKFEEVFRYVGWVAHPGAPLPPELKLVPLIALLLFIGATGKSAQLPILHIWLPDAMEGPTPVSALIHAATMVTAGVYMVARVHDFFLLAPGVMTLIAWVGVITAFFAATTALVQTDIKRVLAYSTISQIGYMFLGAGVGAFTFSIFHLMTHAFFKALLFLGSGAVIHAMHNEQDMRKMGGLHRHIKPVSWLMLVGVFTISGCPLLSGFFSKDAILSKAGEVNILLWVLGTLTAVLTAFYMFRLWFMTFWGEEHWQEALQHGQTAGHEAHGAITLHPNPPVMIWPMAVLAVLSIVGGAMYWVLPGFLDPVFQGLAGPEGHAWAPEPLLWIIAALVFAGGWFWAYKTYWSSNLEPKPWMTRNPGLYHFLSRAWYIDHAAHVVFAETGEDAARAAYEDVEVRGIDRGGVLGLAAAVRAAARELRWVQSGIVADYALAMALGAAGLVLFFLTR